MRSEFNQIQHFAQHRLSITTLAQIRIFEMYTHIYNVICGPAAGQAGRRRARGEQTLMAPSWADFDGASSYEQGIPKHW